MNILEKLAEVPTGDRNKYDLKDLFCWRCKTPNLNGEIELRGGFICHICSHCRNAWSIYLRGHPLAVKLDEILVRYQQACARTTHDGIDRTKELSAMVVEERQIRDELFEVGRQWVAARPDPANS